ncbi:protein FAM98C isoform X2 [Spea bombifrons]|uniref:protein FAM98C isoform X2 n=1 Tax=Spea bombifrons TaxID=233779 RepID=UPI00234A7C39|nr:protein FAM98C isoform X2 [Spea bombifrons]
MEIDDGGGGQLEACEGESRPPETGAEELGPPETGAAKAGAPQTAAGVAGALEARSGEAAAPGTLAKEASRLLQELGYAGSLCREDAPVLPCALGAACQDFTSLCVWLVSELRAASSFGENVTPTEGPEDAETFQLEMSGVLSELHCPYPPLTTGEVTARLTDPHNCLLLLVFLGTELQAARILDSRRAPAPDPGGPAKEALQELQRVRGALGLAEPALDTPVAEYMRQIETKVRDVSAAVPEAQKSPPLLKTPLLAAQWDALADLQRSLRWEYECRMRMLVTRFDVTVQSFHWSERAKEKGSAMQEALWPLRRSLTTDSGVSLSHLLAAREDDSRILHTCNAAFCQRTGSAINKVLMVGTVPDRGGRPNEIEPPMPTWEKRREGGGRGGQPRWGRRSKRRKN